MRGLFLAINCAALPEQLLESELFGFERGAFTGAVQAKPGQSELAGGGVWFLDEVTEMSPVAQAKFLRVRQEREFLRLGGTRPVGVNVRVIAAASRNLDDGVAQGYTHGSGSSDSRTRKSAPADEKCSFHRPAFRARRSPNLRRPSWR